MMFFFCHLSSCKVEFCFPKYFALLESLIFYTAVASCVWSRSVAGGVPASICIVRGRKIIVPPEQLPSFAKQKLQGFCVSDVLRKNEGRSVHPIPNRHTRQLAHLVV